MSTLAMRLPRLVESDPRAGEVIRLLTTNTSLLWKGGAMEVPMVPLSAALAAALGTACSAGRIVRGLEGAERRLSDEEHGLHMADRQGGTLRGARISRLLVLSDDGAERFYRAVESLLRRHGHRVIALRIEVDASTLGELLFGPGRMARLIMIEHKEAVSSVLLALSGQGKSDASDTGVQGR